MSDETFYRQLIHFDKSNIPAKYGTVTDVQAKLVCVTGPGVFVEPVKTHVEAHIATISAWARQNNYPETHNQKYENLAITGSTLSIYLAPTLEPKSKKLIAFGKLCAWLLTMDDILDELTYHASEHEQNTYRNVSTDLKVYVDILDGKLNTKASQIPGTASTINHHAILAHVLQDIHDALVEAIPGFNENKQYFVKSINDFLHGFLWRYRRPDSKDLSEETYLYFRRHHSASFVIYEIIALLHDIEWSKLEADRHEIEFENWRNAFASTISMSNDVLSLRKEITDNETENLAIQKYMSEGTTINKALKACISYTNYQTHEVATYTGRLLERHPDDQVLKRLVQVTNLTVDGHLFWYGYTKRYGPLERQVKKVTEEEYKKVLYEKHETHGWVEIGRINC